MQDWLLQITSKTAKLDCISWSFLQSLVAWIQSLEIIEVVGKFGGLNSNSKDHKGPGKVWWPALKVLGS